MKLYAAYLLQGMTERAVYVNAPNLSEAARLAKDFCRDGEYVRGVNPEPVADGWEYPYDDGKDA